MIMETEKSQTLHLASWRPSREDDVSSSPKADRVHIQQEPVFQLEFIGKKETMFKLEGSQAREHLLLKGGSGFLFYLGLQVNE